MRKVALLAVVGLLCISLSSLAGEVITNDIGEDATGLRVVFSVPVMITAFGDILTNVDPKGSASEFVFSGGMVTAWGSHWMSWAPSSAKLISHEWLRSSHPAIKKSTLDLPTTTLTQFPLSVAQTEPATGDTDNSYYALPVEQYSPQGELPVDGMSSGSVPLNWWYSFDRTENGPNFHGIEPIQKDGEQFVQYTYPDDGDVRAVTSQFTDPVDASSYKAFVLVARADHAINVEINLGYYDHNLPATEDGEPCGSSGAVFATEIPIDQQERVYVLPLAAFHVTPWAIEHKPGASTDPNLKELLEASIALDDEGTIEILRVAFAKTMPKAVTAGKASVINDYYFQQPAYVMQGVGDLDEIYALPLRGVPELGTGYAAEDLDGGELTWSVTTSDPGIGAGFQDQTLYIWGADANWSGYGEVVLTVTDADGMSDSIAIPVTVFRDDKTLINAEGEKDYFVPWSPELDVNRIVSVEEHMRKYHKDEGNLDRSIQWSRWKMMEYRWDVDFGSRWHNELIDYNWPVSSQFALVDVLLSELVELGIESLRVWNEYLVANHFASEITPVFDDMRFAGPTKRPYEEAYIVNEAHRLGLTISLGNLVSVGNQETGEWEELYAASPSSMQAFLNNYNELNAASLLRWHHLGIDMVDLCPALSSIRKYDNTLDEATALNNAIEGMVARARESFAGPIYHGVHHQANFFPGESILGASFWKSFDVIGLSGWAIQLTEFDNPTDDQLVSGWLNLIRQYFQPFQRRFGKPFLMWENGCVPVEGCANYGLICPRTERFDETKTSTAEMARYYTAHSLAFQTMDGYYGPGWWDYQFSPTYLSLGGRSGHVRQRHQTQNRGYNPGALLRRSIAADY